MPGGSSLARFLFEHCGVRVRRASHSWTFDQILRWADAHHDRTGCWPTSTSGPVMESPGDTWEAIAHFLGRRRLLGVSSLAQLLNQHRRTVYAPDRATLP